MKRLLYAALAFLLLSNVHCTKEDDYNKTGVSLPAVSNLALQKTGTNGVKLTWALPGAIPDQILQPMSVWVEVRQIRSPMQSVSLFTQRLPNAPVEFSYTVPDVSKSYRFIVKLYSTVKVPDRNYSSTIYSLGQSVSYN